MGRGRQRTDRVDRVRTDKFDDDLAAGRRPGAFAVSARANTVAPFAAPGEDRGASLTRGSSDDYLHFERRAEVGGNLRDLV